MSRGYHFTHFDTEPFIMYRFLRMAQHYCPRGIWWIVADGQV